MNFIDALKSCFSQYATFSGRARRSEYWWFTLALVIISIPFAPDYPDAPYVSFLAGLVSALLLLPSFAVQVRRFHDIGRSAWNLLWALVPVAGVIVIIVFSAQRSEPHENRYGHSPVMAG